MGSRVFVGGLSYKVRESDVEWFFRKSGRVKDIAMKSGFAFVEFDDHRDADDAIHELNGKELLGERVSVERARGTPHGSDRWLLGGSRHGAPIRDYRSPPKRSSYRLIVENLSSRVTWRDLKEFMRDAGDVCYANAHNQRMNTGVVEFGSHAHMKTAIEMFDNAELNGRRIQLAEDPKSGKSKRYGSRSRSRSRSKHRSRSRSQSRSRERS